ncbi:MAG: SDR family oxidoreductase [Bacteroidota bacterium]
MRTLLILGSNSDVGKACAYRYARENFNILLASRTIDEFQTALASDVSIRYNVTTENVYFDALKTESHNDFYNKLKIKPDVVISAFGYLGNQTRAMSDSSEAALIINTNFNASISILSIVANDMERRKAGTIIGISSVAGERGRKGNYIYGASKAGVTTFLCGLRTRLAPAGVHVATIKPGFIKTKMTEGLNTPEILTASPGRVADAIWKAYRRRKKVTYVLPVWRFIMWIIRNMPEALLQKTNV